MASLGSLKHAGIVNPQCCVGVHPHHTFAFAPDVAEELVFSGRRRPKLGLKHYSQKCCFQEFLSSSRLEQEDGEFETSLD